MGGLLVLTIHGHAGKDVCEGALVAKLAVTVYELGTDPLLLAWFKDVVEEGAGGTCGAGAGLQILQGTWERSPAGDRGEEGRDEEEEVAGGGGTYS